MPSELTFRAQLVLKEQRQVYDYWCRQAGKNIMPCCDDLDVRDISSLTHSLSLLKIHSNIEQSCFYSAGTRTHDIYGRCVKDMTLDEFNWGDTNRYWRTVYGNVVLHKRPRQGVIKDPSGNRDRFVIFWLRLPLSENGRTVTDVLCHDTPYPVSYSQTVRAEPMMAKQAIAL